MTVDEALLNFSKKYQILHVPGIGDSGETHWQTDWESRFPEIKRVIQKEWDCPDRDKWVKTLESCLTRYKDKPIILIAHSLGGGTVIHADHLKKLEGVKGVFMVALPDIEREDFPKECSGFSPMPKQELSIPGLMISSENDEWCAIGVAEEWSNILQIPLINIGKKGHICGVKEFEAWDEGKKLLLDFLVSIDH